MQSKKVPKLRLPYRFQISFRQCIHGRPVIDLGVFEIAQRLPKGSTPSFLGLDSGENLFPLKIGLNHLQQGFLGKGIVSQPKIRSPATFL